MIHVVEDGVFESSFSFSVLKDKKRTKEHCAKKTTERHQQQVQDRLTIVILVECAEVRIWQMKIERVGCLESNENDYHWCTQKGYKSTIE